MCCIILEEAISRWLSSKVSHGEHLGWLGKKAENGHEILVRFRTSKPKRLELLWSQGTDNGVKPIHRHDQKGVTRGYLLRETPQRMLSWNNRKKSVSPGCKEMLLEKMKEIEAFNASRFEMIEKEEIEKKFIFSYGVGDVTVEARDGNFVIPNVHYTPEVTLNVISYDLLEEQGYTVEISNNKCYIHYMFGGKGKGKAQVESVSEDDRLRVVVTEHNKFLDEYFESIEPKDEGSLVKGLEELKWDRDDEHDYVDEEYISWNGSLYAIKVNSLPRFLSFMNLIKKDGVVYKNWDIFSKKYVDMLKWFYLVYLNNDMLDKIPPVVGVMEINLLSLHKIVDNLGGDDGEAIKECYRKFIDMVQVYYETAKKPWYERKPKEDVVENSSGNARVKDPQGKEKDDAGKEEALEEDMNIKTHFGVRLVGNMEEEAEQGSITDSNDFEVIV
nr:ARID DNA-binding domain-containing protein [Tanacetum cinerariifolium]